MPMVTCGKEGLAWWPAGRRNQLSGPGTALRAKSTGGLGVVCPRGVEAGSAGVALSQGALPNGFLT